MTTACPVWCHRMDEHNTHTRAVGEVYINTGSLIVELGQEGDQMDAPAITLTHHAKEGEPREIWLSPDEVRQLYTTLGSALAHLGRFEVALSA